MQARRMELDNTKIQVPCDSLSFLLLVPVLLYVPLHAAATAAITSTTTTTTTPPI